MSIHLQFKNAQHRISKLNDGIKNNFIFEIFINFQAIKTWKYLKLSKQIER